MKCIKKRNEYLKRWSSHSRQIAGVIALAAMCLIGLGLVPWQIDGGPFRESAMRRIAIALGAPDARATDLRLTLLPVPRLTIKNLSFAQAGGTVRGAAHEAIIYLKPQALLRAQAKPGGIALFTPNLTIRLAPGDESGFRRALALLSQTTEGLANYKGISSLRRVEIDNGTITLAKVDELSAEIITNVHMRARLPGDNQVLSLSLRGKVLNEEFRISVRGPTPLGMMQGKVEPLNFALWTQQGNFEFTGEGAVAQNVTLKGSVVGNVLPLAVLRIPGGSTKAIASNFSANLDFSGRGANLSDLKISHDNELYNGVASLRHDGQRWGISGTLATDKTDISTLLAPLTKVRKADGTWNDAPIDLEGVFGINLDLRLSAEQMTLFGQTLENAAIAVLVRPGKAELSLGDARYQRGTARFRATALPGSFGIDLKINASLERGDIGSALATMMGVRRLSGIGNALLALETSGRTTAQFVSNAEGKFSINLHGGELVGIDLAKLAPRRGGRPEFMLASALGGKTTVESAAITAKIANGAASIIESHLQSGRLVGGIQGAIDFSQAQHDLTGSIVIPANTGQQSEPVPVLDFSVTGPLLEPHLKPISISQQKRS